MRICRGWLRTWVGCFLVVAGIVLSHRAIPWLLPVDDRSPERWNELTAPMMNRRVSLKFENVALADALAQVGRDSGMEIVVDWERVQAQNKGKSTPVFVDATDVPVFNALIDVVSSAGLEQGWIEVDRRGRVAITDRPEEFWLGYETRDVGITRLTMVAAPTLVSVDPGNERMVAVQQSFRQHVRTTYYLTHRRLADPAVTLP